MSPPSPSPGTPEQSPGEPAAVVDPDARRNLPEQLRRRSSFDAGGRSPPQSKEEKTHAWEAFLLKRMGKQAVPASGYVTAEEALDSVASLLSEMGGCTPSEQTLEQFAALSAIVVEGSCPDDLRADLWRLFANERARVEPDYYKKLCKASRVQERMLSKQAGAAEEEATGDLQSALDADGAEPHPTHPETPPAKRIFKLLARKFTRASEPPSLSPILSPGDEKHEAESAPQPPAAAGDASSAPADAASAPAAEEPAAAAADPPAAAAAKADSPAASAADASADASAAAAPAAAEAPLQAAAEDARSSSAADTPSDPDPPAPPSPSGHDSFGFDPSLVLHGDDLKRWAHAVQQIDKDLPRTFAGVSQYPELSEEKRLALRRVLLAYAQHNAGVGFCQGMNFVAYVLLVVLPEEAAFWALGAIVEDILPGYYTQAMIAAQVDQSVLESLVEERLPAVAASLADAAVPLGCVSAPWFICAFVTSLPWQTLLRVWDVMLLERSRTVLFQVALSLIHFKADAVSATRDSGEVIALLQSLGPSCTDPDALMRAATSTYGDVSWERLRHLYKYHHRHTIRTLAIARLGSFDASPASQDAALVRSFPHRRMNSSGEAGMPDRTSLTGFAATFETWAREMQFSEAENGAAAGGFKSAFTSPQRPAMRSKSVPAPAAGPPSTDDSDCTKPPGDKGDKRPEDARSVAGSTTSVETKETDAAREKEKDKEKEAASGASSYLRRMKDLFGGSSKKAEEPPKLPRLSSSTGAPTTGEVAEKPAAASAHAEAPASAPAAEAAPAAPAAPVEAPAPEAAPAAGAAESAVQGAAADASGKAEQPVASAGAGAASGAAGADAAAAASASGAASPPKHPESGSSEWFRLPSALEKTMAALESFIGQYEYQGNQPKAITDFHRALEAREKEIEARERRVAEREAALNNPVVLMVLVVNDTTPAA